MSLKRKANPSEEDEPSTAPSSNTSASRAASSNGDASSPHTANTAASVATTDSPPFPPTPLAPRRLSPAGPPVSATPTSASSAPGAAQAGPAAASTLITNGHAAKHRRTGSAGTSNNGLSSLLAAAAAGKHQQRAPGSTPPARPLPQGQSSPPSLVVPEALHARFQHAAFPHMINLVPASQGSSAPTKPGQAPGSTSTSGSSATAAPAAHAPSGSGPVVVGQILHPLHGGVIASPLLSTGRNASPLNRAAVLAAAERSGVKALHGLPCINALWQIGSHTWNGAIPIHGIMDGYSRRLLALRAGESSHPKVVATLFRDTVKATGCYPARLRADDGEPVAWVKERMRASRGKRAGWFIHGPAESNQHLEPIWAMVAAHPTISALSAALEKHTADGVFDKSCPLDLLAVQVAYLPQLNAALDEVRRAWNKLPIDGCGFSKVGVWQWNIQEWAKRGRYPATEPESVDLPREALGQHAAEEFVNYGATGGPYVPCSVHTNRPSSENGEGSPRIVVSRPSSAYNLNFGLPSAATGLFSQAPLDDIGDIDPSLRLWLEDFPLPKARGYGGMRQAMGELIAEEFGHVAGRFRVGRDRIGK